MRKMRRNQWSNVPLYLHILEKEFSRYLQQRKSSEKTRRNYISDTRHFWLWILSQSSRHLRTIPPTHEAMFSRITPHTLSAYRTSLVESKTPLNTINRRLSSLRLLFHFCQERGLVTASPALNIANISIIQPAVADHTALLHAFTEHLKTQGASGKTVRLYTADVLEYLLWTHGQSKLMNG